MQVVCSRLLGQNYRRNAPGKVGDQSWLREYWKMSKLQGGAKSKLRTESSINCVA